MKIIASYYTSFLTSMGDLLILLHRGIMEYPNLLFKRKERYK